MLEPLLLVAAFTVMAMCLAAIIYEWCRNPPEKPYATVVEKIVEEVHVRTIAAIVLGDTEPHELEVGDTLVLDSVGPHALHLRFRCTDHDEAQSIHTLSWDSFLDDGSPVRFTNPLTYVSCSSQEFANFNFKCKLLHLSYVLSRIAIPTPVTKNICEYVARLPEDC